MTIQVRNSAPVRKFAIPDKTAPPKNPPQTLASILAGSERGENLFPLSIVQGCCSRAAALRPMRNALPILLDVLVIDVRLTESRLTVERTGLTMPIVTLSGETSSEVLRRLAYSGPVTAANPPAIKTKHHSMATTSSGLRPDFPRNCQ